MVNPVILIADADPKNLQILRDALESSEFVVSIASDGMEAWEKAHSEKPDLILSDIGLPKLDGLHLLSKLKEDPGTAHIPIIFLTTRRDIQDRVKSLRGGVKDYMIKPVHVKEVIARIRMILRRLERLKSEEGEPNKQLYGRLEEFSVVDLIESFGVEHKSGVLSIYNENNRYCEIYFREGAVVHASLGALKGEKAIYQTLAWKQGHFVMIFKDVGVPDSISVSNLGLLLHGYKRLEEREKLFKQLPSPETTFVITETFRRILAQKELSPDAAKFLALIDGRRDVMQLIDEGVYDDLKTLERLVRLHQQGFIVPGRADDAKPAEINVTAMEEPERQSQTAGLPEDEERTDRAQALNGSAKMPGNSKKQPGRLKNEPFDVNSLIEPEEQSVIDLQDIKEPDITLPEEDAERQSDSSIAENLLELSAQENENVSSETAFTKSDHSTGNADEDQKKPDQIQAPQENVDSALKDEFSKNQAESMDGFDVDEQSEFPANGGNKFAPQRFQEHETPEPLSIKDLSPGFDIFETLTKHREESDAIPGPSQPEDEALESSLPSLPPTLEEIQAKTGLDEPAESLPAESEESDSVPVDSFPLRRYGIPQPGDDEPAVDVPRAEETGQDDGGDASEQVEASEAAEDITNLMRAKEASDQENESSRVETPGTDGVKRVARLPRRGLPARKTAEPAYPDLQPLTSQAGPQGAPASRPRPRKHGDEVSEKLSTLLDKLAIVALAPPAKMVLIGARSDFIEKYSEFLLEGAPMKKLESRTFEYLGFGDRQTAKQQSVAVIGVSMEQQFTHLLDSLADGFASYILLIDASDHDGLAYINYLHTALKEKYKRPFGLAVVPAPDSRNFAIETVRDLIGAAEGDFIATLDLSDERSMLQFLEDMLDDKNLYRWQDEKDEDTA